MVCVRPLALIAVVVAVSAPHSTRAQPSASAANQAQPAIAARQDSTPRAGAVVPVADSAKAGRLGIKLSGYVETAFNASNHATGRAITGRLYDRTNKQFSLSALKLSVDRPYNAAMLDAGFHADMLFGQNAPVLQSAGFSLGPNGDVYQLYGTLSVPTPNGNGVQLKFGRMATFLGLEAIETPLNPNLSIGNQFIYAENFTQTGLSIEHRFNKHIDAQVRVLNGWDQVADVNGTLSYMARLGITLAPGTSIALAAYTGAEEADDNRAKRSGVQLLASQRAGRVTAHLQADLGVEDRNPLLPDPSQSARWNAVGAWMVIDATPHLGVALRGDYFHDRNAFRTGSAFGLTGGAPQRLSNATVTLNVKGFPNVLIRPELRYDTSNRPVFNAHRSQLTSGVGVSYIW